MQRLGTGTFLFEILKYFDDMIRDPTSSQKFQMFSGHDYNLAGVLNSLGAYNPPHSIPFATSIYFELRKNKNNTHYVTVWLLENNNLEGITIKGCDIGCPLNEVKRRLSNILIDVKTHDSECQENTKLINKLATDIHDALKEEYISKAKLNKHKSFELN